MRDKNGLTQREVAEQLNTYISKYDHWENGRSAPRLDDLIKIAQIFKVSLHQLAFTDLAKEDLAGGQTGIFIPGQHELYAAYCNAPEEIKIEVNALLGIINKLEKN
jgi:transcriptional regulator with XRE-family HTH domain